MDTLPDEIISKIIGYLPTYFQYQLIGPDKLGQLACDHYYSDIYISNDEEEISQINQDYYISITKDTQHGNHIENLYKRMFSSVKSFINFYNATPYFKPNRIWFPDIIRLKWFHSHYANILNEFNFISLGAYYTATIPTSISSKFKDVELIACSDITLPKSVENLTLENCKLKTNPSLKSLKLISTDISNDQLLQLNYVENLELYSSFHDRFDLNLPNLNKLTISPFKEGGDFHNLPNLTHLSIDEVVTIDNLRLPWKSLKYLEISEFTTLEHLHGLHKLSNLKKLILNLGNFIVSSAAISSLRFPQNLEELTIDGKNFEEMYQTPHQSMIFSLSDLKLPDSLKVFEVVNNKHLLLSDIEIPTNVVELKLNLIHGVDNNFMYPKNLKRLYLTGLTLVNTCWYDNLEYLEINYCQLTHLSVANLHKLTNLQLKGNGINEVKLSDTIEKLVIDESRLHQVELPKNCGYSFISVKNCDDIKFDDAITDLSLLGLISNLSRICSLQNLTSLIISSNFNGAIVNHDFFELLPDTMINLVITFNYNDISIKHLPKRLKNLVIEKANLTGFPILPQSTLSANLNTCAINEVNWETIPKGIKALSLKNNKIKSINGDFTDHQLEFFDVLHNLIEGGKLVVPKKLEVLNLNDNKFKTLDWINWDHANNLCHLYLYNNDIDFKRPSINDLDIHLQKYGQLS